MTVNYHTRGYFASDGGNFKIEIYTNRSTNGFSASMFVNGYFRASSGTGITNGRGHIDFSGLKAGDIVSFEVQPGYSDTVELKFYD